MLKDPCGTMLYINSIDDLLFLLVPLIAPSFPTQSLCLLQDQCVASILWAQALSTLQVTGEAPEPKGFNVKLPSKLDHSGSVKIW